MTIGIYLLRFNGTDQVYVGQSVNIEVRYRVHKQKMRQGTHNYKVQEAFKHYGIPSLEILCECMDAAELNTLEEEAFEIYNSVDNGLNVARNADIHLQGELNGSSKYTNEQILEAFLLLQDPNNSFKSISILTKVSESTIRHISSGEAHSWIQEVFPEEYSNLPNLFSLRRAKVSSAKSKGINYPLVKSPTGEVFKIDNANAFARSNGMDSSYFIKLLNGKAKSCKGWVLA